jgi:replication factor A1
VLGATSRARTGGGFEVHLNRDSVVEVIEEGVLPREAEAAWAKIGELRPDMRNVSAAGKVMQINEPREFTKKDGSKGKVASVVLQDDTGIVRLSLWDDDVGLLKDIEAGTTLAIENGYTRAGYGGGVDLNAGRMGRIRVNPEDVRVDVLEGEDRVTEIRDLVEGQKNITVKGQLLDDPVSREVNTQRGPVNVVSFRIDDGTGEARVSLWRDHGKSVEGLTAGAELLLENCNIREPFDGLMQVSSTGYTKIKVIKK